MKYIFRTTIGVICVILMLNTLALVFRGVYLTYEAYHNVLFGAGISKPMLPALEAVDMFFMAIASSIMAIGVAQLFLGDMALVKNISFSWLRIESFSQLKLLLWDTFLVTLMVVFVTHLIPAQTLGWEMLILPGAILLLTISSYLLKRKQ